MNRLPLFLAIALLAMLPLATGCIEDDFTTSSSDVPAYSTDTIAFDTIFTELATPTASFKIYNKHKKMLNISNIRIKGESNAKFYLNVDGVKDKSFNNIEIRGEDSIFVYVQAFIDPTDSNNPIEYKDKIEIITNGVTQELVLTAWGQDVNRIYGGEITENKTFTADKPYLIFDTLQIAKDATLTLLPGTTLFFHDKGALKIDGSLKAIGSKDAIINLRGDRLDKVVGDVSYDIMSGQWAGLIFTCDSYYNEMSYVYMRGSSTGIQLDSCDINKQKLHLFNSVLHNSSSSVLNARFCSINAEGTEFSDAANSVVSITGGKATMINCTIANYYLFSAISGALINLEYLYPSDFDKVQLLEARFDNCLLYGNTSDINHGELAETSVLFRNCLLRSSGSDDANFINCKWGGDPKFYTEREKYIFDYRLRNESDAIAIGNKEYCPASTQFDRYGNDRFAGAGLDIGAYVWIKAEEEKQK
ncbi:MAG: hypothetical protein PHR45_07545 [Muribaculaceae bacterium]|nr:hypothetical protein [Muribaculaceae bacterium]